MQRKGILDFRRSYIIAYPRIFESQDYLQCAQINRVDMKKECVFYNWYPQNPQGTVSQIIRWRMKFLFIHTPILAMRLDANETTNSNVGNYESL